MTIHPIARSTRVLAQVLALGTLACSSLLVGAAAQNLPITTQQRQTAQAVAQRGVPLSALAAQAPQQYTVKAGDTLWGISGLYLQQPWRWPELWGMNLDDIRNPHRIYPGQVLLLEHADGLARLRLQGHAGLPATVKVAPRTRYELLSESALPTLRSNMIEAFLAEPLVIGEGDLREAPRIVSAVESRVLIARGDRVYARGPAGSPLLDDQATEQQFRVFRNATVLRDPITAEVLGYEAQYIGKAALVRSEGTAEVQNRDGSTSRAEVPATIDILATKEEIRVGDRLLPEPPRQLTTYTPHAPDSKVDGRIVSVYGSAVINAGQNQVVAINLGGADGMRPGTVLAIQRDGAFVMDRSDGQASEIKLPDERNGLLMVFRTFERVSYALIVEITVPVRVGDRLINPRL